MTMIITYYDTTTVVLNIKGALIPLHTIIPLPGL
jgi:hypothetical protein